MKICFAALLAATLSAAAQAQGSPAKPVHLVVPYVAGGNADIFGRTLAQKLGDAFRQPFIVENRAGANFFFQAEDGIRDHCVTGVQTCALPISPSCCPAIR